MSSPTLNFSALTPPLWLQQDIARRAPGFPGTQAYFLFSDDLPGIEQHNKGAFPDAIGTARQNKLREIMQNVWPQSLDALGIDPTIALNSLGQLASNGTANTVTASSRLTGQSETTDYVRTAPSHAVIMLPPRAMSVRAFTAAVTNLPVDLCAELPNVIPQRAIAGHEIGHLRQRSDIGLKLTPNGEEARADSGAYADCQRAGNPESGDYLYQWRLLSNFLSDLTTDSTKYWNSLFQYGISDRAHEEYASQLEIKLVGSVRDSAPLPPPQQFIADALNPNHYPSLHACFNQHNGPSPVALLQNLNHNHRRKAYQYQTSFELAEQVLVAAHRLAPGVFKPS